MYNTETRYHIYFMLNLYWTLKLGHFKIFLSIYWYTIKHFLEIYINGSQNTLQKYSSDIRETCMTAISFYRRGYQVWEKLSSFLDIIEEGDHKNETKYQGLWCWCELLLLAESPRDLANTTRKLWLILFTSLVICLLSFWLVRIASHLFLNSVQKYIHHLWTCSLLHLLFSLPRGIRPIQKVILSLDKCSKTNGFIHGLWFS